MFSAALGLVGGIGSLIASSQQQRLAMEELQFKRNALRQQETFGMLNYGMARDQQRKQDELTRYILETNERNALAQSRERARIEEQRKQRLAAYQDERAYVVDRQMEIDKASAEQYALELEAYLQNRDLAQSEREAALEYLEVSRSIAAGERDEDLRRLRLERLTAEQERDFAVSEMRNAQAIARGEREDDLRYRDAIVAELNAMGAGLEQAYASFGQLEIPEPVSETEIMETLDEFDQNAISNVDRAADRVASEMEASLYDRGIQSSTPATARRAEIAGRLAQEYDNARLAARNQAMDYIRGRDNLMQSAFNREVAGRSAALGEIRDVYTPEIQGLLAARGALSANSYQLPVGVNSANVIRGVASANQFGAPIAVQSATMTPTGMSSRIGPTLNAPSTADAHMITGDYNQVNPQLWNVTDPSVYMGTASGLMGNIANRFNPNTYFERSGEYSTAGWENIGGAINDLGKSNWFKGSGSSGSSDPWAGLRKLR